jgi:ATP-dependent helicase/nuclease subunit B
MPIELNKSELLLRLAEGHAAGVTVITPNRRLAQSLAADLARRQVGAGRTVWESPDILPVSAFVERLYQDALYAAGAGELPLLLGAEEEQSLWEDALRGSQAVLLALPETAALAREAWQLAHAHRLRDALARGDLNDDARVFVDWARRYERASERLERTDFARLPDELSRRLDQPELKKPQRLVRFGFDQTTPQQDDFFAALAACGVELADCAPERRAGRALRVTCLDARDEIRRAARWARARLEAGESRIAVVVPDLAERKQAIRREFARLLAPAAADPRAAPLLRREAPPFNISLGEPLAGCPLVAHALAVLELCGREIEFERASLVIRSPFVAQGGTERESRARLDAALRRRAEPRVTLERLALLAAREDLPGCPALARMLAALAAFRKERLFGAQGARAWGEAFNDALSRAGFPGERELDSAEYQTLKKWHEALAQFARLERVAPRMGFGEALARIARIAQATLFQPETPEVPIQVLGALEAAGMEFDHLWVMGLSDEAWPMRARANPFIPIRLQRAAGVPNASAAAALEFARRLTEQWLGAAAEVVLSHPLREGDRALAASPLIAHIAEAEPSTEAIHRSAEAEFEVPPHESWREAILRSSAIERIADTQAPALAADAAPGGASLIRDQAACPFRALAIHRLGAEGIEAPHAGLDALERGTLVHRVLASVWRELKTKWVLDDTPDTALEALLARAAEEAIAWRRRDRPTVLAGRFAKIEAGRLARLARDWLAYERGRGDFEVLATEDKRELALGELRLKVRLDRVDQTADGARIVIDYKTGKPSLAAVLGARPDEPQLPLYLVAAEPQAAALAFARVSAGEMRFVGLAREAGLLDGAKTVEEARKSGAEASWDAQLVFWRAELERLAARFAAGDAEVDPKRQLATCRGCGVQPFCRVYERIASALEE